MGSMAGNRLLLHFLTELDWIMCRALHLGTYVSFGFKGEIRMLVLIS